MSVFPGRPPDRSDTPDSAMSNGSEPPVDTEDDVHEILTEFGSIKTAYNNIEISVSEESLEGVVEVDSETDLKRKRKLQVLQKHIIGMSQAYSELLESTRKLKLENSDQLSQLHSQLEHAEQRAKEAEDSMRKEAQCSEAYKDDLQAVLDWVTGGHSSPPPELKTTPMPSVVCSGEEYRNKLSTALAELSERDKKILMLQENLGGVEKQLSDKEKRAREERQVMEKDISELESKLYSAEDSWNKSIQEVSTLKIKEEQLVKALRILKEKVEPLQNETELKGKDLLALREALEAARNRLSILEAEKSEQKRDFTDKLGEQVLLKKDLEAKLEEQNVVLAQLLAEKEGLQLQVSSNEEELDHLRKRIKEQNLAIEAAEEELSVQEGLVKSASEDKTKAEEVIATLRREIAERERVLKSLIVSLCDLAEQVGGGGHQESPDSVIQKHADDLDQSLSVVFDEIERLRRKWLEASEVVLKKESAMAALKEDRQTLNCEIDQLQQKIADLDLLLKDKDDQAATLNVTIKQLQSDLQCCHDNFDKVVEEKRHTEQELTGLHDNALEQCKFLQEQLDRRQETLEDLTQQQEGLQEEYSKCCQDITSKQRAIQTLEDVLREKGEEISALMSDLEAVTVDKDNLQEELQKYHDVVESLHKEMGQKEASNSQQLKKVSEDHESLQKEFATVQNMVQEREKLLGDLRASKENLEKKRKKAESEVVRHRDAINSLEDRLKEAQSDFDHIKTQLYERERELQACRQAAILASESMNDKIRQILLELESLRLTKDSELSAVQAEYSSLARSLQSYKDLVRSKDQEMQVLRLKVADLEDQLAALKLHYQPYEDQVMELVQTVDELREQVSDKTQEVDEQREEMVQVQNEKRKLKANLEKCEVAQNDLQALVEQLQAFPHQWTMLGKDIRNSHLKDELEELEQVFADMKSEQTQLEDKIKTMERALTKEKFEHKLLQDLFEAEKKRHSHNESYLAQSEENGRKLKERLVDEEMKRHALMEECSTLQAHCHQMEEREAHLKQQVKEVRNKLMTAEAHHDQESIVVERLREEVEKHRLLEAQLKETIGDMTSQLNQTRKQLREHQDELQRDRVRFDRQLEVARRCSELESELSSTCLELQRVHSELVKEQEGHCRAKQEAEQLEGELSSMRSSLSKLIRANCDLHIHQSTDVDELDGVQAVLNGAQAKFNEYVVEIKYLKQELENTAEHLSGAEEEREQLKNSLASAQKAHLITQKELLATKNSLSKSQDLSKKLQEDCDSMANQISMWAKDQRITQDKLADRIRLLEKDMGSLKAEKQTLERQNEAMELANKTLQSQLDWAKTVSKSPPLRPHGRSNSVTHVQATLDVSIQHGQKNGKGNENEATVVNGNEASDSMLQWQSQYATALQKGLTDPGTTSPPPNIVLTKGSEDMDKLFWMTRANQLSLQLQQSTEFWSEKVRLLSSQLEGNKT